MMSESFLSPFPFPFIYIFYHYFQDDSGDETNLFNAYVDVADPEVAEHPPVWW